MRVLLLDTDRCGLDLALRAGRAGHEVRWWIKQPKSGVRLRVGDGFKEFTKVADWRMHAPWADLIVYLSNDDKAVLVELDRLRKWGKLVFGPTVASAAVEVDRGLGMRVLEQAGVACPAYKTFASLAEAEAHVRRTGERFVFKTLGDEENKALSYVASDPADLVGRLRRWQAMQLPLKGPVILQEYIEGIEAAVSGWMTPEGFLPGKFNVNFEHKKLMSGDLGPNTGEMGTVCKYVDDSQLAEEVLLPIEDALRARGHIGDLDVNCIISEDGTAYPLEFTARFGWPSTWILTACHKGDPVEWMRDACKGHDSLIVDTRVALGVVLAQPKFPYGEDDDAEAIGNPISGTDALGDRFAPVEVMQATGPQMHDGAITDAPQLQTSGDYVGIVTALGPDVHDAIAEASEAAARVKFANRMYRNDIGKRLEQELPRLHALGYSEMPHW